MPWLNEDRLDRIASGRCRANSCKNVALPGIQECARHNGERVSYNRRLRAEQEAANLCRYGKCQEPVVGTGAYCAPHKQKRNALDRWKNYGITQEEWEQLLAKHDHRCAICRQLPSERCNPKSRGQYRSLHVDHDHETGAVRGLLCGFCNLTIGHLEKNKHYIERMISYMREHGSLPV